MEPEKDEVEGTATETPSLRDTISQAMDQAEESTEEIGSETEGAKQEAKQGLERDAEGKLKPKDEAQKDEEGKDEEGKNETAEAKPKDEQPRPVRAPGTWRPALREKFAKLDPDVQQEILKREREIHQGFNEVGEVKKFRDHFLGTVNQYSNVINAEGGRPLETIHNLLKTANVLYAGTPIQKAQTVAAIIKNFGIDITTLDEELSGMAQGQPRPQTAQPDIATLVQQQIQAALAPMVQQRDQQVTQSAQEELDEFASNPENEFFEDVKETMADILEAATARGTKMDLQTAYRRAILAHNDIADVVARRQLSKQTTGLNSQAQAKKKKSVSLSGAPDRPVVGGENLRETIIAAMEQHGA